EVSAKRRHEVETADKAGSSGGIAISPAVSVAIVKDTTAASVGRSPSTTVSGASQSLAGGVLNVGSTTGFASSGVFAISDPTGVGFAGTCSYTGTSGGNEFTGITGCTGTPINGMTVTPVLVF